MNALARPEWRHWHPVMLTRDLGARPRQVSLLGVDLVVFRTALRVGVLLDECPHRRMQLSRGHVAGDCVVCPYHGYRFDADGHGTSAGTPRLHAEAVALETRVAHDAIWVRRAGSDTQFPDLVPPSTHFVGAMMHAVDAALEPLVDNFSEVEHTPTTHALFGYRQDSLAAIEVELSHGDDWVRVVNRGPQKALPRVIEWAFGLQSGDEFIDDWTTRFSPIHIRYQQWWRDPKTHTPRPDVIHPVVVFTPNEHDQTTLFTFVWSNRAPTDRGGLDGLLRPLVRKLVDTEVRLDRAMVERLASQSAELRGTRLGRFDAALREHRKRIASIYRAPAQSE